MEEQRFTVEEEAYEESREVINLSSQNNEDNTEATAYRG